MATPLLKSQQTFIKGENKNLSFRYWDEADPNHDVSAATVTIGLYDRLGAVVSAQSTAALSGTTLVTASRQWDSTLVTPGAYKALAIVNFGTLVQYFQWPVLLTPFPAP